MTYYVISAVSGSTHKTQNRGRKSYSRYLIDQRSISGHIDVKHQLINLI